ncbi:MAG: hypothetical protein WAU32_01505 [Thermoanaerobaculia bacterium]
MKRWEAWWNHSALIAVSVTGVLYGLFKYFVPGSDPDSRVSHPLQPWFMKAHILVAPFAVMGVGLLLRRHALARIRSGESNGRRTGTAMLWLFLPLALTGYLVQVFTAPGFTRAAGYAHAALGLIFLLGYSIHPKRRTSADTGTDEA